ncbi:MFS transporter [Pusillimonas minor]|uniref:MFS transporter n=1 Tax=Pusillimonas minor TaxID=2697024 RepID=A0A842HPI4_9BURK|nr:MFS transporter [Pusillimonas minor]MBC2770116.1 MFS transporter [Pusillimonas minor]
MHFLTLLLNRWGGFAGVTATVALCFATSSLPTPLYPLYEQAWDIPPSQLSYVFSAYMACVLASLLCFGRVSDTFGRFPVVVTALVTLIVGLVMSMLAPGVPMLLAARVLIGIGNGMLMTTAALAMGESHPDRDKRKAAVVNSTAVTVSFGLGPVLGGVIGQFNVYPLVLPYVFVLVLAVLTLFVVLRSRHQLAGPVGARAPLSVLPKVALPGAGRRVPFLQGCIGGFFTFAVGCMFASLVPSLLPALELDWQGPLVVGVAFLFMSVASLAVQMTQTRHAPFVGQALGMFAFALSVLALIAGMISHNVWVLIFSMVTFGVGQGFGFMYSAMIVGQYADEHRRSANISTFFLFTYTGASVPVVALGLLADRIGLASAIFSYSAITAVLLALLTVSALVLHQRA